jgi:hypothetical protein
MDELNKYTLKGMITSLQEALNEDNLDEFKRISIQISERIGTVKEVKPNEVSDNNTTFETTGCSKTDKFIELLLTDNQQELFNIFEDELYGHYDLCKKYNIRLIYDHIKNVKNMNPSILHMIGYCISRYGIKNEKPAEYYFEQCWKTHRYAAYRMYFITKDIKYLKKSFELKHKDTSYLLGKYYYDKQAFDKATKYFLIDCKSAIRSKPMSIEYLIKPEIVDVLLKGIEH